MNLRRALLLLCLVALAGGAAHGADPISREQALHNLENAQAEVRHAAVVRLGEIGRMQDAQELLARLKDADAEVRKAAEGALWTLWSRSGDPKVDALLAQGTQAMNSGQYEQALAAFNRVIRQKPAFAEGWNKRATLFYLAGETRRSIADCKEVLKRNPSHFGALSGFGLLYLRLEEPERALEYFERAQAINPGMVGVEANIEALHRLLDQRLMHSA